MKLAVKVITLPVIGAMALAVWICSGLLYVSSGLFGLIGTVLGLLGLFSLATGLVKYGIIFLILAFLAGPLGIPMAAAWLLGKVQELRYAIQDRVYG